MACTTQSMLSASSCACAFTSSSVPRTRRPRRLMWGSNTLFLISCSASSSSSSSSSSSDESDCNVEECAPEKEVGNLSMEWLAGDKTKVVGTFPPKKKGWTGYVEKDTAGQTNIYSVEPTVYVAESAISSGSAGTSADGAEKTVALAAGLALISVAAASSILLQVSKNQPSMQATEYSGPPLSYYIGKFKPEQMVAPELQSSPSIEASVTSKPSSSSTVEALALPDAQQLSSTAQLEDTKANVAPEVQVDLKEQTAVTRLPATASNAS